MRAYLAALMIIVVSTLALQGRSARAAGPTAAGLWEQVSKSTGKPDAWFVVSERDSLYEATLVKILTKSSARPNRLCTECSGDQRNAPWLGLTVVKGMERNGLDYDNGTILDPRDGSQYYGRMRLSPDGQSLTVRGNLGIDPLGGDETWRRLPNAAFNELDPALAAGHVPTLTAESGVTSPKSDHAKSR
jgi:uncharacterized protein (DUF2147 family)